MFACIFICFLLDCEILLSSLEQLERDTEIKEASSPPLSSVLSEQTFLTWALLTFGMDGSLP